MFVSKNYLLCLSFIDIIACMETDIPTVENGNYTLIDGDVEYGARVQYSCDPGYMINVEDNFLQCNEEQNWIGTIPICTFVECEFNTIDNIME